MRFRSACLLLALLSGAFQLPGQQPRPKPKLVLGIVIDQFRYDYLLRFHDEYHSGLQRLLRDGAVFTNAYYRQAPTVTAVGHSIFMSGAMPSVSGIISNSWYDRSDKKEVTSVCDWSVTVVGAPQPDEGKACTDDDPASPHRLLVSTVGDEMRNTNANSKVIGISLKPRAAILPSGHRANAAYWFDSATGNFVSSSFYLGSLPQWAQSFNEGKLAEKYSRQPWPGFPDRTFEGQEGKARYGKMAASPWGNELIEKFAEAAARAEQLGCRGVTDLLTVSFSSNDYVGHEVGPDASEVHDMSLRTDALIGQLLGVLDRSVGLQNVLVVLTADHGVAPVPTLNQARKMPGEYVGGRLKSVVTEALNNKFGTAPWIESGSDLGLYFNRAAIAQAASRTQVVEAARDAILSTPDLHVARVFDWADLARGMDGDFITQAFVNGFYPRLSPDLAVAYEPYIVTSSNKRGTTHFSPYGYDTHVPVIFLGAAIKPGHYSGTVAPNDIAPTLALLLDVETPSGSSGRVLTEMLR